MERFADNERFSLLGLFVEKIKRCDFVPDLPVTKKMDKTKRKIIFCPNKNVRTKLSTDFFSNNFFTFFYSV
jgi:hypothetical protein